MSVSLAPINISRLLLKAPMSQAARGRGVAVPDTSSSVCSAVSLSQGIQPSTCSYSYLAVHGLASCTCLLTSEEVLGDIIISAYSCTSIFLTTLALPSLSEWQLSVSSPTPSDVASLSGQFQTIRIYSPLLSLPSTQWYSSAKMAPAVSCGARKAVGAVLGLLVLRPDSPNGSTWIFAHYLVSTEPRDSTLVSMAGRGYRI